MTFDRYSIAKYEFGRFRNVWAAIVTARISFVKSTRNGWYMDNWGFPKYLWSIDHGQTLKSMFSFPKRNEFREHFIFGLPESFFAEIFASCIFERLEKTSNFYFTSLEGLYSLSPVEKKKYTLTIGDDIDLMSDQLRIFESNSSYSSKSLSKFLKSDDSCVYIKCKRITYTTKAGLTTVVLKAGIHFTVLSIIVALGWHGYSECDRRDRFSRCDRFFRCDRFSRDGFFFLAGFSTILHLRSLSNMFVVIYDFLQLGRSEFNVFVQILIKVLIILGLGLFTSLVFYFIPKSIMRNST